MSRLQTANLRTGPFRFRLRSDLPLVLQQLAWLYPAEHLQLGEPDPQTAEALADFHVDVLHTTGLRRWVAPRIRSLIDGAEPFAHMAPGHAFAFMEWSMNWAIAANAHHYLMLHAACLEREGVCVVLPGVPGAGKSTLTAGLMLAGWRLLTDECTLIDPTTARVHALARPINLKNHSIDLIEARAAGRLRMSQRAHDTHKGTVGMLQASPDSIRDIDRPARITHVIFPKWGAGQPVQWAPMSRGEGFEGLVDNAFNYSLMGRDGFNTLATVVQGIHCQRFSYSDLDEGIAAFNALCAGARA